MTILLSSLTESQLTTLFRTTEQPAELEQMGKAFSLDHFLAFLDFVHHHPAYHHRLLPILIGLPSPVFSQALSKLEQTQLNLLKQEPLEPLYYQLNQFVHEGEALHKQMNKEILQWEQQCQSVDPLELTPELLNAFYESIENFKEPLNDYLMRMEKALSIAWQTDRPDLLERMSALKELLQHQLMQIIGNSSSEANHSTGLYTWMETLFSQVFNEALEDEDSAIEGLTRLSIWYPKDYWEMGLLPNLSQSEVTQMKESPWNILHLVQEQLNQLGIGTVANLKSKKLFSKSLLKAYILTQ